MTIHHHFLDEIETLLEPNESIEELVRLGVLDLELRLQESDTSMLSGEVMKSRPLKFEKWGAHRIPLALDFGGSFIKLAFIDPENGCILKHHSLAVKRTIVDKRLFQDVVDWICQQIDVFLGESGTICPIDYVMGVTFSFPLDLNGGLTTMGKGFILTDELKGAKVTELLQWHFDQTVGSRDASFSVLVSGIVNDSVAVYLANAVTNAQKNNISLILGTGINACFSIPASRLPARKLPADAKPLDTVLINSELGFLGQRFINLTGFDCTSEPHMPLEFVTSGRWIPQTLYNILKSYHLLPKVISGLEFDGKLVCGILDGSKTSLFDETQQDVQEITRFLIKRAAIYATAALLSILHFTGSTQSGVVRIGYVGSFLQHCYEYKNLIQEFSQGRLELVFLEHSNLIGAFVNSEMKLRVQF
ncbi:LADA_0H14862g1_1 [Lachancea dasiensis]|uniref:Phosphotransferase n=1 Tax=Lachancea dasiensis TaxID=1072105 RepID=A0A1G4K4M0_9SACH|nr:LADA_0H14862g1_1 [Lachancea dasiensis]